MSKTDSKISRTISVWTIFDLASIVLGQKSSPNKRNRKNNSNFGNEVSRGPKRRLTQYFRIRKIRSCTRLRWTAWRTFRALHQICTIFRYFGHYTKFALCSQICTMFSNSHYVFKFALCSQLRTCSEVPIFALFLWVPKFALILFSSWLSKFLRTSFSRPRRKTTKKLFGSDFLHFLFIYIISPTNFFK